MPQPSPAPRSAAVAAVRAVLSAAVLLVLVAGLPVLLCWATTVVGPPGVRSLGHLLSTQDSGQVFLLALAVVGWAGWAMFAVSVLVEIPAQLAGRSAPRLRFAVGQRTAATLVSAMFFVLPAGTALASAAAPAHAATPVASAPADTSPAGTGTGARPVTAAGVQEAGAAAVTHTVQAVRPAESLWSIAEQRLGDGDRWEEIAALNTGRTMPGGTVFRADAAVQPGWVLHLPDDATPAPATTADASWQDAPGTPPAARPAAAHGGTDADAAEAAGSGEGQASPETYTVRPGDSLSRIAADQLGDADRWPQIYRLNKGQAQPGGHHLTDPDLIYPHEVLRLPGAADAARPAPPAQQHTAGPAPAAPPASQDTAPTPPVPPAAHAEDGTAAAPPSSAPSASPSASEPAPQSSATAPPPAVAGAERSSAAATVADATPTGSRMPLYAAGGGLLAAAFLAGLALRRRHQQRRRGIGRRIALPTGSAAATEQALRATQQPDVPAFIDTALRTAAVHLAAAGRELPELAAAVFGPENLDLHLAHAAPSVPPFTADDGDLTVWRCPTGTSELLDCARTAVVEAPYPALVTLGTTEDGRTVLVDLEQHGLLVVTGPDRLAVVRALAVELATSQYAEHLEVAVAGEDTCPGLPGLVPEWFTQYPDPERALRHAKAHHQEQAQALAQLGADGLRQARLRDDPASAWSPYLLLADDTVTAAVPAVFALPGLLPRTATVVVTAATAPPAQLPAGGWVLGTGSGPVRVPSTGLDVHVQTLPHDAYDDLVDLLATSDQPDRPAPAAEHFVDDHASLGAGGADVPVSAAAAVLPAGDIEPPAAEPGDGTLDRLLAGLAGIGLDDLPEDEAPAGDDGSADDAGSAPRHTTGDNGGVPAQGSPAPGVEEAMPPGTKRTLGAAAGTGNGHAVAASDASPSVAVPAPARAPVLPRAEASAPDVPLIRVLGPVDIVGASGPVESKHARTITEIAAWMVLHPGLDHHALDEAIWPGRDVSRKTRNPWISRLRKHLGTSPDGAPYLPAIATTDDARYRFSDRVTSDWHVFQDLAAKGMTSTGDQADDLLRTALDTVRGRPFAAAPPYRYVWAEHTAQDMIAAIVDVAAALGERRLALADPRGALWASTKGLDVAPEAEHLYRITFRAYHALGDHEGLQRAAEHLDRLCDDLGSDREEATTDLLRSLLAAAAPRR